MMPHKHLLHELLKEDQEPFHLKDYIADKRCQLRRNNIKNKTQNGVVAATSSSSVVTKRSRSNRSFCKHACFMSFQDSPDVRKSPFPDFPSPASKRSPFNNKKGGVLLLEAAMRVHHQQSSKTKPEIKNSGLGLFGSILKRLKKDGRKSKKGETASTRCIEEGRRSAVAASCSCNNSRISSAGWSESNEEKSMDLESCSSCCRSEDDVFGDEKRFCSSPFRFALRGSPSPVLRSPAFSSPVGSPTRHKKQDNENYEVDGANYVQLEDEEKEQCSPVSVLDNPFEDGGDEGHEDGDDEVEEDGDYDLDCSYAILQRAKQKLFDKLSRFEKLAELDPIELEKRMDAEDYDEDQLEERESQEDESLSSYEEDDLNTLITQVLCQSSSHHCRKIPDYMKSLVLDLISEEKRTSEDTNNEEVVVRSISKKLNSWREVQSNTIEMMVQLDIGKEINSWKNYQEQMGEISLDIELEIFRVLMDELCEDLVY